jgi:hypothetical protein
MEEARMKAIIEISCDNAAFKDEGDGSDDDAYRDCELARILRTAADHLSGGTAGDSLKLYDINGNKVGTYRIEDDE